MGLIDFYEPPPPLRCPLCDVPLGVTPDAWQGPDGPCAHYWGRPLGRESTPALEEEAGSILDEGEPYGHLSA